MKNTKFIKNFKFGNIFIKAEFMNEWTSPKWDDKNIRPLYRITIRTAGNKIRRTAFGWGNLANSPDLQHRSLAGCVLQEAMTDPETFEDFCSNYGYDEDSRHAFDTWRELTRAYHNGDWRNEAEEEIKKWEKSGDNIDKFLTLIQ
jgi:hypothetical protein